MLRHCLAYCDICQQYLGQLWNEPAAARDLLPPPDFYVCDDCLLAASVTPPSLPAHDTPR